MQYSRFWSLSRRPTVQSTVNNGASPLWASNKVLRCWSYGLARQRHRVPTWLLIVKDIHKTLAPQVLENRLNTHLFSFLCRTCDFLRYFLALRSCFSVNLDVHNRGSHGVLFVCTAPQWSKFHPNCRWIKVFVRDSWQHIVMEKEVVQICWSKGI